MVVPEPEPTPEFRLTKEEREQWGIRYETGVLTVRSAFWSHCMAGVMIPFAGAFIVAGVVAVFSLGVFGVFAVLAGVYAIVNAVMLFFGSIVATPDGVTIRLRRTRHLAWDEVDDFRLTHRPVRRALSQSDIVEVVPREGRRILLPFTTSFREGWSAHDGPSAATLKRDVLLRYRDTFAPA